RHVPERDVEDIVQATLAEALSPSAPKGDDEALRRWLVGVARHKVADRHRRARRESFDLPELAAPVAPHAENDLVRWAERALPGAPMPAAVPSSAPAVSPSAPAPPPVPSASSSPTAPPPAPTSRALAPSKSPWSTLEGFESLSGRPATPAPSAPRARKPGKA